MEFINKIMSKQTGQKYMSLCIVAVAKSVDQLLSNVILGRTVDPKHLLELKQHLTLELSIMDLDNKPAQIQKSQQSVILSAA